MQRKFETSPIVATEETVLGDTCRQNKRREESASSAIFCVSAVPRPKGDNPSLHGSSTSRNRLSPWVVDETTKVYLFVGRRRNDESLSLRRRLGIVSLRGSLSRKTAVSLCKSEGSILCGGGCRRRGSVSVALLNGDGALFDGTGSDSLRSIGGEKDHGLVV
ncbi:hypothetical protein YC2023_043519 [Brassica napus]